MAEKARDKDALLQCKCAAISTHGSSSACPDTPPFIREFLLHPKVVKNVIIICPECTFNGVVTKVMIDTGTYLKAGIICSD